MFLFLRINRVYKLDTYEPYTRSHTPGKNIYFSDADRLYKEAKKLLDVAINERAKQFDNKLRVIGCGGVRELRVRLLGIRVTQLRDTREERKGSLDSVSFEFPLNFYYNPDAILLAVDDQHETSDDRRGVRRRRFE